MEIINHECYVSLEVAKLLKEAGFDLEIDTFYQRYYEGDGHDNSIPTEEFVLHNTDYAHCSNWNNTSLTHINGILHRLSAPTLDVAQRWLREVKGVEVYAHVFYDTYDTSEGWDVYVYEVNHIAKQTEDWINSYDVYHTYEESQEAGIKKVLELILEKGE